MTKKSVLYFLNNIEEYLCQVLISVMLIVSAVAVFFRYVVNDSISWSEEVCRMCIMWLVFLGASCAVKRKGHLYVDVLYNVILKNNVKIVRICETFTNIIWIGACILYAYYGFDLVARTNDYGIAIRIPMKIPYSSLPIGMVLMAIRVAQATVKLWKPEKETGDTLTDDVDGGAE